MTTPLTSAEYDSVVSLPEAPRLLALGHSSALPKPAPRPVLPVPATRSVFDCVWDHYIRNATGCSYHYLLRVTGLDSETIAYWLRTSLIQPRFKQRWITYEPSQRAILLKAQGQL